MIPSRSTLFFAAICAAAICGTAAAQSYPNRPIKLILPFAPGSPSDMVGRTIGQKMSAQMGQPLVADNRASAGGTLGLTLAAQSSPGRADVGCACLGRNGGGSHGALVGVG